MKRSDFIKTCSVGCLGVLLNVSLLESCNVTKYVDGELVNSDLKVSISEFETEGKNNQKKRPFIIVQHEKIQFPICIFRFNESEYSAVYLKCPHQGAELQVFGDRLHCPAHGSEFSNKGEVLSAPASTNLKQFPTQIINNFLHISLK